MSIFGKNKKKNEFEEPKATVRPLPKFHMDDTVFFLKDSNIVEATIKGVFKTFSDDWGWNAESNKRIKFEEFKYFFDIKSQPYQYGWIEESRIFISKQALIETL